MHAWYLVLMCIAILLFMVYNIVLSGDNNNPTVSTRLIATIPAVSVVVIIVVLLVVLGVIFWKYKQK